MLATCNFFCLAPKVRSGKSPLQEQKNNEKWYFIIIGEKIKICSGSVSKQGCYYTNLLCKGAIVVVLLIIIAGIEIEYSIYRKYSLTNTVEGGL